MRHQCIFITDKEWLLLDQKIKYFNEQVHHFQKELDSLFKDIKSISNGPLVIT
jgi:hypothetical protein